MTGYHSSSAVEPVVESLSMGSKPLARGRVAALVIAVLAVAVVAVVLHDDDSEAVQGVVSIREANGGGVQGVWDNCQGTGRFSGIKSGMKLVLKDSEGEQIGTGTALAMSRDNVGKVSTSPYGGGAANLDQAVDSLKSFGGSMCQLYFEARVSPADSYTVVLADGIGQFTYSRADLMADRNWMFLSLD